jgi:HlyD family secretion protein
MASTSLVATTIKQFQSETDSVCATPAPRSCTVSVSLITMALFAAAVGGAFIPVDRVVTSVNGKITSSDQTLVVQALNPSIIKSIDVKEGQMVEKGQVLATLDSTLTSADLTQAQQQIASLTAEIARAQAQINQQPFEIPADKTGREASYWRLQKSQYDANLAQYASTVHGYDANIALNQATVEKYSNDEQKYRERLQIARKQEAMEQYLVERKTDSLLSLLTATDARTEVERQMTYSHNSVLETQHTLESIKADKENYIQKWYADLAQEIVTARNNLDTAQAQYDKAARNQQLVRLTAPEAGVIFNIDKVSVGSVLKQGDELLTITPSRAPIVAEADIASRDIAMVRIGDPVRLKVDAFDPAEHGYAEGEVSWISEDSFSTDQNGTACPPYYKTQVTLKSYHFVDVPASMRLASGMTLTADINVGSRSLGRYLLGDTLNGSGERMR